VRYPEEQRQSLRELANERIFRPGGVGEIPLSTAANLVERRELSTLTSIDGQQTARVTGEADASVVTPLQARRQVNQNLIPDLLAMYPGLVVEPDGSAREERTMLDTLRVLVPLVMIAMYVLIAAFLRSYWKPLIAVVGVPIAFAGSVFVHWILGWDYGFLSLFGLIGVAGVIVNDALVLMDRYNTLRRENEMLPAIAAASAATRHRFRAVFLTSLTTVLALAPLLYERSDVLMFLVPFVVSMLGGLIFSGLFILFLLPSLVMIAEAGRE
jgi:multidrug efflux pump subunit AcrB